MNHSLDTKKLFESSFQSSPGHGFQLRPMGEKDLDIVLDIEQTVQSHPWKRGHFQNSLQIGNLAAVIEATKNAGQDSADIVGFVVVSSGGGEAELLNIAVTPALQRRGLAAWALQCIIDSVQSVADNVFLEVRQSNRAAIAFYEKLGFNQVGERRNYYPAGNGNREDALIMALTIAL